MSGDDLTIVTFLIATAISLGGIVMSALGWKHPILIGALSLLSVACAASGLGWPFLKQTFPEAPPYLLTLAQNPASWFATFMAMVLSFALLGRQKALLRTGLLAADISGPNTLRHAIKASLPVNARRYQETNFDKCTRRWVAIDLTNEGDGWLTNGLLEVVSISPAPIGERSPLTVLKSGDDFQRNMRRTLVLVGFNKVPLSPEYYQAVYNDGPTIFYSAPGTYGGGAYDILSATTEHIIRLRASANECQPHEIDIRVWVGSGRTIMAEMA